MNKSKKRQAFTLLELIAVMAIIALLSVIITPVYQRAILSAKTTAEVQRMRQIYTALSLYQDQWGFKGYDNEPAVGMPDLAVFNSMFPDSFYVGPCGYTPSFDPNGNGKSFYYSGPYETGMRLYQMYRQNSLLVADFQCNTGDTDVSDLFVYKRVLGVLISGQLTNRWRSGDVFNWSLYTEPPE
jgi:prepilin-type N-terminal cleavage/methylation domain-containing protein